MTRVLVCGGRGFNDRDALHRAMLKHIPGVEVRPTGYSLPGDLVIIHGAAPGADSLAAEWAFDHMMRAEQFPADWKTHGRAAGPIRNQRMINEGRPDLVIAMAGGRGTADMVRRARKAGIEVVEVKA